MPDTDRCLTKETALIEIPGLQYISEYITEVERDQLLEETRLVSLKSYLFYCSKSSSLTARLIN